MGDTIFERLANAALKLRNMGTILPVNLEISISELIVLNNISKIMEEDEFAYVSEIADIIPVSKPAVSQILRSLEKSNCIERTIAPSDHRRVAVKITEHGAYVLNKEKILFDSFANELIHRMGKDNIEQLICLAEQLCTITAEMKIDFKE